MANTAVFTTKFGITDKKDITFVMHEKDDGTWQFFSNIIICVEDGL
jgi:hypothetical protein